MTSEKDRLGDILDALAFEQGEMTGRFVIAHDEVEEILEKMLALHEAGDDTTTLTPAFMAACQRSDDELDELIRVTLRLRSAERNYVNKFGRKPMHIGPHLVTPAPAEPEAVS